MKRVIYIMGAGRTGTTLIDIILGNADDIFSCGELINFPKLKGKPHGFGEGSEQSLFWKKIEKTFFSKNQGLQYVDLVKTVNAVESHRTFYKNILGLTPSRVVKDYCHFIDNFLESIFSHINEDIIVDSSKYPGRALALSRQNIRQVDYIYLVRNPMGVVHSFSKPDVEQPPKNYFSANIYYFLINLMCHLVKIRTGKSGLVTIRYEDLIQNSTKVLTQIQNELSLNLSIPIKLIENKAPLKVGYLFEGNRIRLNKEIAIGRMNSDFPNNWRNTVTSLFNGWWW